MVSAVANRVGAQLNAALYECGWLNRGTRLARVRGIFQEKEKDNTGY